MKNVKYIMGAAFVLLTLLVSYFYLGLNSTSANPDYICIKRIPNPVCTVTSCDEWNTTTHERMCYGKRVSSWAYYHTRTNCEAGYTTQIRGGGYGSGASGRKSSDFIRESTDCQILEVDNGEPSGEVEQILDNGESLPVSGSSNE